MPKEIHPYAVLLRPIITEKTTSPHRRGQVRLRSRPPRQQEPDPRSGPGRLQRPRRRREHDGDEGQAEALRPQGHRPPGLEEGHRDARPRRQNRTLRGDLAMPIKQYKPTSPGRRDASRPDLRRRSRSKRPEKSLTESLRKKRLGPQQPGPHHRAPPRRRQRAASPRSSTGSANKPGVPAKVVSIEYDPNRTARIALLQYRDGEKRYILAPNGLTVGATVFSGPDAEVRVGQHAPAREHADRHAGPQHRAHPRPRRPDGPQRRRQRPADGEGRRLRPRPPAQRRDAPRPHRMRRHHRPGQQRRALARSSSARPGAPAIAAAGRRSAARS